MMLEGLLMMRNSSGFSVGIQVHEIDQRSFPQKNHLASAIKFSHERSNCLNSDHILSKLGYKYYIINQLLIHDINDIHYSDPILKPLVPVF